MTVPFTQYLEIKDNYCLAYFGEDIDFLNKMLDARHYIERELPGLQVFIACKDMFQRIAEDRANIILESKMMDYKGKMAHTCNLEKKDDLKALLLESKIPIPKDF